VSSEPMDRPSEPDADAGARPGEPSEAELRAAYEAELSRITSAEVMLQSAVSLLNIGSHRLGAGADRTGGEPGASTAVGRDLEQVSDAIDGVRALLSVLERRLPTELGPLRDALSQLQIAYSREAQAGAGEVRAGAGAAQQAGTAEPGSAAAAGAQGPAPAAAEKDSPVADDGTDQPGPAEASGRLWVPGR
jgi:hypothetical protein